MSFIIVVTAEPVAKSRNKIDKFQLNKTNSIKILNNRGVEYHIIPATH